ncbi:hypothetical protein E5843_00170 [Luteimonas yindakuii]|uniref:hypothetical protein n=1 Tax=Luteimonas yindakuii TaxID=2565782 RepID=UPI0010A2CB25|nr:hypothetical protein [Luteimonas yindakuii]QCO66607.1 hypothetical protein E5843_00170 [Luteimonas yindakuii]
MIDLLSSLLGLGIFAWGLGVLVTHARPGSAVSPWLRPRHRSWRTPRARAQLSVGVLLCGVLLMAGSPVLLQLAAVAGIIVLLFTGGLHGGGDA